ncbi:MAG: hypothetical protein QXR35_05900, partial [Candidatus Korarchaeum sp.]
LRVSRSLCSIYTTINSLKLYNGHESLSKVPSDETLLQRRRPTAFSDGASWGITRSQENGSSKNIL